MSFSAPEDDRETTHGGTNAAFARSLRAVSVPAVSRRRVVGATGSARSLGAPALVTTRGSSVS